MGGRGDNGDNGEDFLSHKGLSLLFRLVKDTNNFSLQVSAKLSLIVPVTLKIKQRNEWKEKYYVLVEKCLKLVEKKS
jgi:hypothetical protein